MHGRIAGSMISNEACLAIAGPVRFVPRKVLSDEVPNKTTGDSLVPLEESDVVQQTGVSNKIEVIK
jgi:hypothetical protein